MGIVLIPLSQISAGKKFDKYVPLQKLKMKNEVTGDIHVIASYKAREKKNSSSRRSSKSNEGEEASENESFSEKSMDMSMSEVDDVPSFRKPIRGELKLESESELTDQLFRRLLITFLFKSLKPKDCSRKGEVCDINNPDLDPSLTINFCKDYFCKMAFDSEKNTTDTIEGTTAPKWNKSYTL